MDRVRANLDKKIYATLFAKPQHVEVQPFQEFYGRIKHVRILRHKQILSNVSYQKMSSKTQIDFESNFSRFEINL